MSLCFNIEFLHLIFCLYLFNVVLILQNPDLILGSGGHNPTCLYSQLPLRLDLLKKRIYYIYNPMNGLLILSVFLFFHLSIFLYRRGKNRIKMYNNQ